VPRSLVERIPSINGLGEGPTWKQHSSHDANRHYADDAHATDCLYVAVNKGNWRWSRGVPLGELSRISKGNGYAFESFLFKRKIGDIF
jgi:hypothetical protein